MIKESTPEQRKILYNIRKAEIRKKIKEEYERPKKIYENLKKAFTKGLPSRVTNKAILKTEPRQTIRIKAAPQRSGYFKQEWEGASWA